MSTETIWKYTLDPSHIEINMPKNAKILTAREQGQDICIWAQVDPQKDTEVRMFEVFGTGHIIKDEIIDREYIGTASLQNGTLIFHVFERKVI